MKYLLDTNILSEPTKPRPRPQVLQRMNEHKSEIAVPVPAWHELWFGCSRLKPSGRRRSIERYLEDVLLASFPILAYGRKETEWHARVGSAHDLWLSAERRRSRTAKSLR